MNGLVFVMLGLLDFRLGWLNVFGDSSGSWFVNVRNGVYGVLSVMMMVCLFGVLMLVMCEISCVSWLLVVYDSLCVFRKLWVMVFVLNGVLLVNFMLLCSVNV